MRSTLLLLFCLALAACTSRPTDPGAGLAVEIDRVNNDPALSGPDVHFSVENRSGGTLYLARCGERIMAAVDRWQQGRWAVHSSDGCQAVLRMDPLELGPGSRAASAQAVQLPGRYRLRVGAASARGREPAWTWTSGEFTVE